MSPLSPPPWFTVTTVPVYHCHPLLVHYCHQVSLTVMSDHHCHDSHSSIPATSVALPYHHLSLLPLPRLPLLLLPSAATTDKCSRCHSHNFQHQQCPLLPLLPRHHCHHGHRISAVATFTTFATVTTWSALYAVTVVSTGTNVTTFATVTTVTITVAVATIRTSMSSRVWQGVVRCVGWKGRVWSGWLTKSDNLSFFAFGRAAKVRLEV